MGPFRSRSNLAGTLRLTCAIALQAAGCFAALAQQNSIPFQLQDNLIRVPAVLNGHPVEAVLDSGTGSVAVDRQFALSQGIPLGASNGTVPGGGAAEPMFPLKLTELKFGPERLTQVSGVALDLSHLTSSAGFPVQLLLGQPVFEQRALRVDYPGRQITFLAPGQAAACADPIPFSIFGGTPLVEVTLQATPTSQPRTLHMVLDLGTRHLPALIGGPYLETAESKALESTGKPTQIGTGTGGATHGTPVKIAALTLGTHKFADLNVALTRDVGAFKLGFADGSLGVPLWEKGTVTFDYPNHQVCIDLPAGSSK